MEFDVFIGRTVGMLVVIACVVVVLLEIGAELGLVVLSSVGAVPPLLATSNKV